MKAQAKKSKTVATTRTKPAVKPKAVAAKAKVPVKSATAKKSAPQPASRVSAKKVTPAKALAKPVSAKAKPATKSPAKKSAPAPKPIIKKTIKTAVKPPAKAAQPVKAAKVIVDPAKTAKVAAPVPSSAKVKKLASPPAVAAVPATVRPAEKAPVLIAPPALKPGRRSSARALAQMPPPAPMVPTHAPDAAKASYSTMTERVIAPPPHVAAKKDPKLANNWKAKAGEALSDDEVKAMPDSEYMNDKQMAFFRHKLSVLKQDIHNSAGETTEHLREDTVVVPDPADRATIEEEHALELRTRDRERKLLKKIEQSIARIDSGDYGYCDETGEPIGVGRLIARPTANLSLEAQQRRELKQKMFGD